MAGHTHKQACIGLQGHRRDLWLSKNPGEPGHVGLWVQCVEHGCYGWLTEALHWYDNCQMDGVLLFGLPGWQPVCVCVESGSGGGSGFPGCQQQGLWWLPLVQKDCKTSRGRTPGSVDDQFAQWSAAMRGPTEVRLPANACWKG